jgi:hypothetical protein
MLAAAQNMGGAGGASGGVCLFPLRSGFELNKSFMNIMGLLYLV